jgi:hypothetical protein
MRAACCGLHVRLLVDAARHDGPPSARTHMHAPDRIVIPDLALKMPMGTPGPVAGADPRRAFLEPIRGSGLTVALEVVSVAFNFKALAWTYVLHPQ